MILEADGLRLRELVPADLDTVAALLGDPQVMRFWPRPYDRAEAAAWIADMRRRYAEHGVGYWMLEDAATGESLGQAGLLVVPEFPGEMGIGYILRKEVWGRGIATRAGRLLLAHGFRGLGRERLICLVRPENTPSRAVAERLGFAPGPVVPFRGFDHIVHGLKAPPP